MKANALGKSTWARAARLAGAATVAFGATQAMGCLDRPLEPIEPRTTSTVVERLTQSAVDKIDLLLMIDNSRSMADKYQILALAVPDLVRGLVNPKCLDSNGVAAMKQPNGPLEDCPTGYKREFNPVVDIHIGIVTSSLGGHGSDACNPATQGSTNDDHGHLIDRKDLMGGVVPTYNNKHFLAWDPKGKDMPVGEKNIGDLNGMPGLVPTMRDLVVGVGQEGCGFESQLEGWYRFLVDPNPYDKISVVNKAATPDGIDTVLLQERADFMRPSSLLAVIMLTDENDCSTKEYSQYYLVNQLTVPGNPNKHYHLPRAREECDKNPADMCCASCGSPTPAGCPASNRCMTDGTFNDQDDNPNERCWDTKRRFGIDFLYPLDRYVQGLTSVTVPDRKGELVPNPIFSDLNPNDSDNSIRDQSLVFLAGIVGVPWQDIARDPSDLSKGFKTFDELNQKFNNGDKSYWDIIIGDPANYVLPTNPLMIESIAPRTGTDPITGAVLAPAGAMTPSTNPINGKEWDIPKNDDLQYACVFDLPMSRDCSDPKIDACDCSPPPGGGSPPDSPLCNGTTQLKAKGYPGLRELGVIKGLGGQGIPASICPKQVNDPNAADFGYRPAIGSIIARLKLALGGKCLPRKLTPDNKPTVDGKPNPDFGHVPCLILEARNTGNKCSCDTSKARAEVSSEHKPAELAAQHDPLAAQAGWDCFCEITQASGDDLAACQADTNDPPVNKKTNQNVSGWCYIDAATAPPIGNAELVKQCPDDERRLVRFVGDGNPSPGATLFITCSGE